MAHWAWYLFGAVAVAEIYRNYTTPEEKSEWENKIKAHHGEVGILTALAGILTKSPRLTATGIGLAVHDWDDRNKWFNNSKSNIVVPSSPFYVWNPKLWHRIDPGPT